MYVFFCVFVQSLYIYYKEEKRRCIYGYCIGEEYLTRQSTTKSSIDQINLTELIVGVANQAQWNILRGYIDQSLLT